MRNAEKLRIRRAKINHKIAKTLKKARALASTSSATGIELGIAIVSFMTVRQLKHVLLQSDKFERAFPGTDMKRLAESQLIDLHLDLREE